MNQQNFNIKRVWHLLYIDIRFTIGYLSLSLLVPLLFFFFMSLNPSYVINDMFEIGMSMLYSYILIGGIVFTANAFIQMYDKSKNHFWYMLPANPFEKFISKLLFTLVFYFIFLSIGFLIIMLFSQLFFSQGEYLTFGISFIQDTFIPEMISYFVKYAFYNSIFLLGAVLFKSKVIFKTVITIIILFLTTAISYLGIEYIFGAIKETTTNHYKIDFYFNIKEYLVNFDTSILILSILFLWTFAFFIMKRTQVSDGV